MTILLSELRKHAFWEEVVCLDCGAVVPAAETAESDGTCTECGSSLVFSASEALAIFEAVDQDEEGGDSGDGGA